MKAKEELIKLVLDNDFITAPRLRAEFRSLLDRVEIEAQAEFKNCNIPLVIKSVCQCSEPINQMTNNGMYCLRCENPVRQTVL